MMKTDVPQRGLAVGAAYKFAVVTGRKNERRGAEGEKRDGGKAKWNKKAARRRKVAVGLRKNKTNRLLTLLHPPFPPTLSRHGE